MRKMYPWVRIIASTLSFTLLTGVLMPLHSSAAQGFNVKSLQQYMWKFLNSKDAKINQKLWAVGCQYADLRAYASSAACDPSKETDPEKKQVKQIIFNNLRDQMFQYTKGQCGRKSDTGQAGSKGEFNCSGIVWQPSSSAINPNTYRGISGNLPKSNPSKDPRAQEKYKTGVRVQLEKVLDSWVKAEGTRCKCSKYNQLRNLSDLFYQIELDMNYAFTNSRVTDLLRILSNEAYEATNGHYGYSLKAKKEGELGSIADLGFPKRKISTGCGWDTIAYGSLGVPSVVGINRLVNGWTWQKSIYNAAMFMPTDTIQTCIIALSLKGGEKVQLTWLPEGALREAFEGAVNSKVGAATSRAVLNTAVSIFEKGVQNVVMAKFTKNPALHQTTWTDLIRGNIVSVFVSGTLLTLDYYKCEKGMLGGCTNDLQPDSIEAFWNKHGWFAMALGLGVTAWPTTDVVMKIGQNIIYSGKTTLLNSQLIYLATKGVPGFRGAVSQISKIPKPEKIHPKLLIRGYVFAFFLPTIQHLLSQGIFDGPTNGVNMVKLKSDTQALVDHVGKSAQNLWESYSYQIILGLLVNYKKAEKPLGALKKAGKLDKKTALFYGVLLAVIGAFEFLVADAEINQYVKKVNGNSVINEALIGNNVSEATKLYNKMQYVITHPAVQTWALLDNKYLNEMKDLRGQLTRKYPSMLK